MKLIIDIDEADYHRIENGFASDDDAPLLEKIFKNGTPIPKGHGRLIILSEDAIKREQTSLSFSCQNWISEVGLSNATVAIIEAGYR